MDTRPRPALCADGGHDCLELGKTSLYAAHEMAQLIPISGLEMYYRLLESNAWSVSHLPKVSPREAGVSEPGHLYDLVSRCWRPR